MKSIINIALKQVPEAGTVRKDEKIERIETPQNIPRKLKALMKFAGIVSETPVKSVLGG